jgi:hypothetical protein
VVWLSDVGAARNCLLPGSPGRSPNPRAGLQAAGSPRFLSPSPLAPWFLAETTVKTHAAAILRTLELRDRLQAVIYGYEHGLVRPGENPSE